MKIIKYRKSILTLLFAMMMFGGITVYADSFVPPQPFEVWSEDGRTVFRWNPENGTARVTVYRDGEFVYCVENLPTPGEAEHSFFISADFRHFVFRPTTSQVMALGFFEDGVLLRSYRIDELVRNMSALTYSTTMAMWENWSGRSFNTADNTLTIVTYDDITYVFDVTTGEIIHDTIGNAPVIPHAQDSWMHYTNTSAPPVWAQNPMLRNECPESNAFQYLVPAIASLGVIACVVTLLTIRRFQKAKSKRNIERS